MTAFVLLTARDCHLCAHGREVLDRLTDDGVLAWREIDADSEEGRRLAAVAPPLRPVLFDPDGRAVAYGRLSAKRLRRGVAAAA